MWEPVGPLPAAVYWRRRWVAIGSATALIVALTWGIGAMVGDDDDPETRLASRAAVSAPQEASPPPAAPPFAALPSGSPPFATRPPAVLRPGAAGSTPPTPDPLAAEQSATEQPATEELVPEPPTPTAPPEPVPCTNEMIAVRAEAPAQHRVGERALLRLVVVNTSDRPCIRDLDPERQEIVVWSADGVDRLWSSNDCSSARGADPRTLEPGEPLTFSVRWVGRTSAPGCPVQRQVVPAGEYRLLSRVDDVISPPTQFIRNP
ncbi:MAG TPA: hypothetical protein VKZ81_26085 [Pseudonocardia sp.]|uniref:hypothetical protein n=1 Tax=Pseudonocardia sp. TaxID=60912 RepID=UPI002B4B04C2|nr:hypothetical protein [Pseudonocardia sp.]HLU58947.1 hypothetical protein [Pseudonocardia sp.]